MKNVVFLGNCQAEALARVYQRLLAPFMDHRAFYIDATRIYPNPTVQINAVREADIIVAQQFDFPPAFVADELKSGAVSLGFPSLVATFYWPYARTAHPHNQPVQELPSGPYGPEVGDNYLNREIKRKTPVDVALREYRALDIASAAHLDGIFKMTIQRQRSRDDITGIYVADFIENNFRHQYLFRTTAHPNLEMFRHLAAQVYKQLGAGDFLIHNSLARMKNTPFPTISLPIHPGVIRHFGLKFANDLTKYEFLYEGHYTFDEYCERYLRYEWNQALQQGVYLAGEDPENALTQLDRGLAISPRSVVGWTRKSHLLGRVGQHDAALQAATCAVDVAPDDVDALLNLAACLTNVGAIERAKDVAVEAIYIDPHNESSYTALAEIYIKDGKAYEAVQAAREAALLAPGEPHVFSVLSEALAGIGDLAGAEEALQRARDLTFAQADPAQAAFLSEDNNESPSLSDLQEQGLADIQVKSRWVHVLRKANKVKEAEEVLRELVKEAPDVQDFRHILADVLQLQGHFDEAIQIIEELLSKSPDDPHLYHTLGHALNRYGELPAAAAAFRKAMELNPSEKDYERCLAMLGDRVM